MNRRQIAMNLRTLPLLHINKIV